MSFQINSKKYPYHFVPFSQRQIFPAVLLIASVTAIVLGVFAKFSQFLPPMGINSLIYGGTAGAVLSIFLFAVLSVKKKQTGVASHQIEPPRIKKKATTDIKKMVIPCKLREQAAKNEGEFTTHYSHLQECNCIRPQHRSQVEDRTICIVKKIHPPANLMNEPLRVVSVGSGGCLQELVYIAKLIEQGYTDINLHLIESDISYSPAQKDLDNFINNHFPEAKVQIFSYTDTDRAISHQIDPHLLLLIDIDGEKDMNRFGSAQNLLSYSLQKWKSHLSEDRVIAALYQVHGTAKCKIGCKSSFYASQEGEALT